MVQKFRKKIIAGNWKMNKSVAEAEDLTTGIRRALAEVSDVDVVLCPPFTAIKAVGDILSDTAIKIGAQNMHWEGYGAYTGEVCAAMLRDLYCHYVILGHSERRQYFGETDAGVNGKAVQAISHNLVPIVCVGETLDQRDSGDASRIVARQVELAVENIDVTNSGSLVIAYEPVWAIGTGRTATPDQAQEMHGLIRDRLCSQFGSDIGNDIDILYGGSMKPDNAASLLSMKDVNGGLIGGAGLKADDFSLIVRSAMDAV